jgi:flagellar protein FliL
MTDTALPPPAPPSRGVKAMLTDLACVVLIGAAVGAACAILKPAAPQTTNPGETVAEAAPEPSAVMDLPPIVTGLASPSDVWIRLEASMVFDPRTLPHPEAVAARIGDDILAYVRTITLKQLEGPIGLETIRADLNDRATTRSEGKVRELVLRTLVVQ